MLRHLIVKVAGCLAVAKIGCYEATFT